MSIHITMNMEEDVFAAVHKTPEEFGKEMRLAAAVKWYEIGEISQEKAAEIAGLDRSSFLQSLQKYRVSPFQESAEEIQKGLIDAD